MAAQPYTINISQDRLDRLKQKLEHATFPDEIEDVGWSQGPPLSEIRRLTEAWKTFDWRSAEAKINEHENFVTPIEVDGFETLDIHFIHKRSDDPDAIPLLFIHGWPGSFLEVLKLKSILFPPTSNSASASTASKPPSFHLIAPSLPNFGFSQGTNRPGFGLRAYAQCLHKLMLSLSYPRYATQSGDWGFWIARAIGHTYPEACIASHYNMWLALPPRPTSHPSLWIQDKLTQLTGRQSAWDRAAKARTAWFQGSSRAYNALHSTRPQTLGYSVADSPVGLLAWLYEKLHDWSDAYAWTDDEVLTFVSVYWFSRAGPAAPQRIYWEVANEADPRYTYEAMMGWMAGGVRLGVAHNPKELEMSPRRWVGTLGNVVYEVENPDGGHFYAHERAEWLARDLQNMFGREINAFGRSDKQRS